MVDGLVLEDAIAGVVDGRVSNVATDASTGRGSTVGVGVEDVGTAKGPSACGDARLGLDGLRAVPGPGADHAPVRLPDARLGLVPDRRTTGGRSRCRR